MSLYAKLNAKQKSFEASKVVSTSLEPTSTKVNPEQSDSVASSKVAPTNIDSPTKTVKDEDWIIANIPRTPSSSTKNLKLLDTVVVPTKLDNLVWAPYYRFSNKLFCARICDNSEASLEGSITLWPIPDDKAVVEIFCQEKLSNTARLLLVENQKLVPFWAENKNDEKRKYPKEELNRWNMKRLDGMRKELEKKYKSFDAKYIYDTISRIADDFIWKALQKEETSCKLDFNLSSRPSKSSETNNSTSNENDTPTQELSLEQFAYLPSKMKGQIALSVGDMIVYLDKLSKLKRYTTITKIIQSQRKNVKIISPLEVEDGATLALQDFVGKITNIENKESQHGLLRLEDYVLDSNGSLILTEKKKKRIRQDEKEADRQISQPPEEIIISNLDSPTIDSTTISTDIFEDQQFTTADRPTAVECVSLSSTPMKKQQENEVNNIHCIESSDECKQDTGIADVSDLQSVSTEKSQYDQLSDSSSINVIPKRRKRIVN